MTHRAGWSIHGLRDVFAKALRYGSFAALFFLRLGWLALHVHPNTSPDGSDDPDSASRSFPGSRWFRHLVEASPDVLLVVDVPDARILYSNRSHVCGHPLPTGKRFLAQLQPSISAEHLQTLEAQWEMLLAQDTAPSLVDFRIVTPQGDIEWLRSRPVLLNPQRSSDPHTALYTLSVVTAPKEAEEALRASEKQLSMIYNEALDVILLVDEHEYIRKVNAVVQPILGYKTEELIGQPFSNLLPDEREREVMDDVGRLGAIYESIPFARKDGSLCPMLLTAALIEWDNEPSVLITLRDVSTQEALRQELDATRRSQAELEQEQKLIEMRRNMLAVIVHQLRQPLSTILASAQIVNKYGERLAAQRRSEHYQRIIDETLRLREMMTEMLKAREALLDNLRFDPQPTDLHEFCYQMFQQFEHKHTDTHTFVFDSQIHSVDALLDTKLLNYALENLLSNAIKYSPNGGDIRLILREVNQRFIITVEDQGIGIPPDIQDEIFAMFKRGSNVGDIDGNGIGLALTRSSIIKHGGKLELHSEVGVGSRFTIVLDVQLP